MSEGNKDISQRNFEEQSSSYTDYEDIFNRYQETEKIKKEFKEAQENSIKDSLTGVYNRRYMDDISERINNSRNKKNVAVCFCDINDLKAINTISDKLGDEAIKMTAKAIVKSVREEDIVCRKGGDEFVIIFKDYENFNDLTKSISSRFDQEILENKTPFAYGFVEYNPNEDKNFLDTIQRGNDLMKDKKAEQKSQQNPTS